MLGDLLESGLPVTRALHAFDDLAPRAWRDALPHDQPIACARERVSPARWPRRRSRFRRSSSASRKPVKPESGIGPAIRRAADLTEATAEMRRRCGRRSRIPWSSRSPACARSRAHHRRAAALRENPRRPRSSAPGVDATRVAQRRRRACGVPAGVSSRRRRCSSLLARVGPDTTAGRVQWHRAAARDSGARLGATRRGDGAHGALALRAARERRADRDGDGVRRARHGRRGARGATRRCAREDHRRADAVARARSDSRR